MAITVPHKDKCPTGWKKECYPRHCDHVPPTPTPKPATGPAPGPTPGPVVNPPVVNKSVHNVVYLVDEHDVSQVDLNKDVNQQVTRNANTIIRRWAWHHSKVNLLTMNVPEKPDSIELHETIADAKKNTKFKWEGYMFDIPADDSALRVGIVEGADMASPNELTGPGGPGGTSIDRVVGFAGTYPDPKVPFGPVVQVRRDDSYRLLAASYNDKTLPKVQFRCAYYITKETPKQPTPPVAPAAHAGSKMPAGGWTLMGEGGNPDEAPVGFEANASDPAPVDDQTATTDPNSATNPADDSSEPVPFAGESVDHLTYDQIMDLNVSDNASVLPNGPSWGGMVFGFAFSDKVQPTPDPGDDSSAVDQDANKDSATTELENKGDPVTG